MINDNQEMRKSLPNDNNINNNDFNNTDLSETPIISYPVSEAPSLLPDNKTDTMRWIRERNTYKTLIKENIEYDIMSERYSSICVGKSNECSLCRTLSTPYRNEIRDYSEKHGTLKTLMKLLNEGEIPAKDVTIWGSEVDKQNKHKKREPER